VKPGFQLPELVTEIQPMADDGPILIQVQYQVAAENREAFLKAIRSVEPTRRRNGALSWRVFADLEKEGRFVERYIVASWAEYIRLRSRATVGDRMPHVALEQYQEPGVEIRVSRLIGVDLKELPLTEN
jgi:quinol monooxygenase YgiN